MKTINKMTIAAVLAATMGASAMAATAVPGLPSDVDNVHIFEFNGSSSLTGGATAITNINDIIAAVGNGATDSDGNLITGSAGSTINNGAFWKSFISDEKVKVFYYDEAKADIAELIFLVDGTALDTNGTSATEGDYIEASIAFTSGGSNAKADFLADNVIDGKKLKVTGKNAILLLDSLSFTTTGSGDFGKATYDTDAKTVDMTYKADTLVHTSGNIDAKAEILSTDNGAGFLAKVSDASVNEAAFVRANQLIDLIAAQLRNGYILDTANAAVAVEAVIVQHNAFLGASIVQKARSIKDLVKTIGLQIAATEVGKVAKAACVSDAGVTDAKDVACIKVGTKFYSIAEEITSADDGAKLAADYNVALDHISGFADSLIAFNTTVNGYVGSDAADSIEDQFGTILVNENSVTYTELEAASAANQDSPFTFDLWTGDSANADGLSDFSDLFSIDIVTYEDTDSDPSTADVKVTTPTSAGNLH